MPWLGWTCGECAYCRSGRENLCVRARFTGHTSTAATRSAPSPTSATASPLPEDDDPLQLAPLLCGGLIGHRALRLAGDGERLGLYGFGAAAHIVCQVAVAEGRRVFAFTRAEDAAAQALARSLGAEWAGRRERARPGAARRRPDLRARRRARAGRAARGPPGGTVVCAGIHMSDIPSFPYRDLWEERVLRSVANLTRADAEEFLALAPRVPVRTTVTPFPLSEAEFALTRLRTGELAGCGRAPAELVGDRRGLGLGVVGGDGVGRARCL